jgi:Putative restriction endonuclease
MAANLNRRHYNTLGRILRAGKSWRCAVRILGWRNFLYERWITPALSIEQQFVEILSPTTEDADRETKRIVYQAIESVQEYVLIAQDKVEITRYQRTGDLWFREVFTALTTRLHLAFINETIAVTDNLSRRQFQ